MKIFISHSSKDKWFADKIVQLMSELGAEVWYDKIDLFIGDNFLQKIHEGLAACTHLIVILSKNSIQSKWVQEELDTFYNEYVTGGKTKVYPFLLDEVWDHAPRFLHKYVFADFRNSSPDTLNPAGVTEIEKEFRGVPLFEGAILRCYRAAEGYRLFVSLPKDKSKAQINEDARLELAALRPKLSGTNLMITGRITYTLALMIGAHLGNICKSINAFDPKANDEHDLVPIYLPS